MHQQLLMLLLLQLLLLLEQMLLLNQVINMLLLLPLRLVGTVRAPCQPAALCVRGQHMCQWWCSGCKCCLGSCRIAIVAATAVAACQVAWHDAAMRPAHLQQHVCGMISLHAIPHS
jgi:hypothetical protein